MHAIHVLGSSREMLLEMHKKGEESSLSKKYCITYPNGKQEIIIGMNAFCKEHGLDQGAMTHVASGKYNHHKGYKAYNLPL